MQPTLVLNEEKIRAGLELLDKRLQLKTRLIEAEEQRIESEIAASAAKVELMRIELNGLQNERNSLAELLRIKQSNIMVAPGMPIGRG